MSENEINNEMNNVEYDANELRILKGLEAVRLRPGMYIGDTTTRGLHHLFTEVVDNSIDEHLAGYCTEIEVVLHKDNSVTVTDNGRGIPTGINSETGVSGVEVAMTMLHAGGKFDGEAYKVSGGLHGVGVSAVNALSEWCEVKVKQNGHIYYQRYERGIPLEPLKIIGDAEGTGTRNTFLADYEIFDEIKYDPNIFITRLRELAYLNKGLSITFVNEQTDSGEPETTTFHYENGIIEFVKHLNSTRISLCDVVYCGTTRDDIGVEFALQYNDTFHENILTFANNIHTQEGGTHLSGFKTALTRVVNNYARKNGLLKEKDPNLVGDDVREGLVAIISVKIRNPQFEGQTKTKLGNGEVDGIVQSVVGEKLAEYFEENPAAAKRVVDKALTSHRAREAARRAADLVKRQNALESSSLPGKLSDCIERDASLCELFIVEGQSAGGNAKLGRNRRTQAVLPLRGKILNVEKVRMDRALENEEIKNLVSALGTGITYSSYGDNEQLEFEEDEDAKKKASSFDISKLRYDKIIIMTDADVDGSHICTLLLTFFFRYMKPLVVDGHVYIAQPPFYRIKVGKDNVYYAKDDEARDEILEGLKNRKDVMVTRFKGLGEMDAPDLADTTMNPETRRMAQVTVEDAAAADELFSVLLGSAVEPRKEYIIKHAKEVTNVDWHA